MVWDAKGNGEKHETHLLTFGLDLVQKPEAGHVL